MMNFFRYVFFFAYSQYKGDELFIYFQCMYSQTHLDLIQSITIRQRMF